MLGPLPTVKLRSSPPRGHGVTPETVRPRPGISIQVMPSTVVFRDACAASMDTVPSPSTKPLWRRRVSVEYLGPWLHDQECSHTAEPIRYHCMIRGNRNRDGQSRLILRSRVDSDDGGLHARDAAPVDTQEEALLGVARRDGALSLRDVQPRRVARSGEGKGVRPAGGDINIPVSSREIRINGEDRVAAAVALSAIVHVVSGPTGK